jgi:hypothetical protein
MRQRIQLRGRYGWGMGILLGGAVLMLVACDQPSGQSDLSKKPPPSLGAIAEVDGSEDTKKDAKKPQPATEQTPAQAPAGGQPTQTAPKQ